MRGIEYTDHTADVGMRVRADDLDNLFERAAMGMTALAVRAGSRKDGQSMPVRIEADTLEELMLQWLREIGYRFETGKWIVTGCSVSVGEPAGIKCGKYQIIGTLEGVDLDLSRHEICMEIKAITRHGLSVHRRGTGWEADILFDV